MEKYIQTESEEEIKGNIIDRKQYRKTIKNEKKHRRNSENNYRRTLTTNKIKETKFRLPQNK